MNVEHRKDAMRLSGKELQLFFVLGWHFNHDNIVRLRDSHLLLYAKFEKAEAELADAALHLKQQGEGYEGELAELREAVAWYFECFEMWQYSDYNSEFHDKACYYGDEISYNDRFHSATETIYDSYKHAEQQLRETTGGK